MVELNDLETSTDEAIRRRIRRSPEFAKHLIYLCKKFEEVGFVYVDNFCKFFKVSESRALQIFRNLVYLGVINRVVGSRGTYAPVKNEGELLIKKYISLCENKLKEVK